MPSPKSRLRAFVVSTSLVVATLLSPPVFADELVKCSASAKECEQQIREMLGGRTYLGVKFGESRWGIVITSVVSESPAALSGLRNGDRVYALNGKDASKLTISEFKALLNQAKGTGRVSFGIVRAGQVLRITTRLEVMSKEQVDKVVAAHLKEAHDAPVQSSRQAENHSGGNH